jgi:hypothetical protein
MIYIAISQRPAIAAQNGVVGIAVHHTPDKVIVVSTEQAAHNTTKVLIQQAAYRSKCAFDLNN